MIYLARLTIISRMLTAPVKILCKLRRTLTEIMEYANETRSRRETDLRSICRHKLADAQEMRANGLLCRLITAYMCKIFFHLYHTPLI